MAWLAGSQTLLVQAGTYPNAVPFAQSAAEVGLAADDAAALFTVDAAQEAAVYPQSIASGDPQANGIVLWTRIGPAMPYLCRHGRLADRH